MLRISLVLIICLVAMMLNAQTVNGSEFIHETIVEVADFANVRLEGNIDVYYTQSENKSIVIRTQKSEHLNNVTYSIEDNTLMIRNVWERKRRFLGITFYHHIDGSRTERIQVFIESPNIERLNKSGRGAITFLGDVDLDKLHFRVSGATIVEVPNLNVNDLEIRSSGSTKISVSNLTVNNMEMQSSGSANVNISSLSVNDLGIQSSGSSRVNITGNADNIRVRSSGSANMSLENLISHKVDVAISGSGTVNVHSTEELNVSSSGSSTVNYRGNPSTNISVSGSGRVRTMRD